MESNRNKVHYVKANRPQAERKIQMTRAVLVVVSALLLISGKASALSTMPKSSIM